MEKIFEILGYNPNKKFDQAKKVFYRLLPNLREDPKDEMKIHFATLLYCENMQNRKISTPSYDYE